MGFTLLEALVVLIMVALIATTLMQAMQYLYRLDERFGVQLSTNRAAVLQNSWLRSILQGIAIDRTSDLATLFTGDTVQLKGLTLTPLGMEGATVFSMRIQSQKEEDGFVLEYRNAQDNWMSLLHWTGNVGAFAYVDEAGSERTSWPPEFGVHDPLPKVIILTYEVDGERRRLLVSPRASGEPLLPPESPFKDPE